MKKQFLLLITIILFINCGGDDDMVKETPPPFTTEAGENISNIDEFSIQLNADNLKPGETGVWRIKSGLVEYKVYFEDKNDPKTIFHGLPGEIYELTWTISNNNDVASDIVSISFNPLETKITTNRESFYSTRLILQAEQYDRGEWTIEGNVHPFFQGQNWSGRNNNILKYSGYENTTCVFKYTTWYGSKSATATFTFNSGAYHQYEALEDLYLLGRTWRYELDDQDNVIEINMGGDGHAWKFRDMIHYPSLQSLVHLKKLILHGDGFYNFPEVITRKYLELEHLDLSGNALSKIPDNIGNLTKLKILDVSSTQDHRELGALPESFGDLINLTHLELSSSGVTSIPESFSNLVNLQYMNFTLNSIEKLPDNIGDLKKLDTIKGIEIKQSIPSSFSRLENLKYCQIYHIGGSTPTLPNDFGNLSNLEYLDLYGKYTTLPESFGNLNNLKFLEITGGSKLTHLPASFGNLSSLESCRIAGSFTTLPSSFTNLKSLKNLRFHSPIEVLPDDIYKLSSLKYLYVTYANLTLLPESIGDLDSLEALMVYNNNIISIPESIGNLKNIYEMDFSYNKISSFPSTIGNLSNKLVKFYIRGNNYSESELKILKELLPNTSIISQ